MIVDTTFAFAAPLTLFFFGQAMLVLFTVMSVRRIRKGLPPPGRFVEIDGGQIHLAEAGEGPPVLMIHGLSGTHANFTYAVFERLQTRFRLIAPDRPGCGYSSLPRGWRGALPQQAALMARLIETLGINGPVTVVGHSLGGAVALQLALDRPELVSRLVLVAPLIQQQSRVAPVFYKLGIRPWLLRAWFAWTLNLLHAMASRLTALSALFGPDAAPSDFATRGRSLLSVQPANYLGACRDALALGKALPALTARLGEVRAPVTLVYGEGDRILDARVQSAALIKALPATDARLIPGGHMLPLTAPDAVAAAINGT